MRLSSQVFYSPTATALLFVIAVQNLQGNYTLVEYLLNQSFEELKIIQEIFSLIFKYSVYIFDLIFYYLEFFRYQYFNVTFNYLKFTEEV